MINMTTYVRNRFYKGSFYYGELDYDNIHVMYYQNQANLKYKILFTKDTVIDNLPNNMYSYYLYKDQNSTKLLGYSPIFDPSKYCVGTIFAYEPVVMMDEKNNFTNIGKDVKILIDFSREDYEKYGLDSRDIDRIGSNARFHINHKRDTIELQVKGLIDAVMNHDDSKFGLYRYFDNRNRKYLYSMTQYTFAKLMVKYFGRGEVVGVESRFVTDISKYPPNVVSMFSNRVRCNFGWMDTDGGIYYYGGVFNIFETKFKINDDNIVADNDTIPIDEYNRLREYYKDRYPNK